MRRSAALIAAGLALIALRTASASEDDMLMALIGGGLDDAAGTIQPARQFVGLFLRVAGIVWIAVEWVAAICLIRGFYSLQRWFAEGAR